MTIKGSRAISAVKKIIKEEISLLITEDPDDVKAIPKAGDPSLYSSDSLDSSVDAYLVDKMGDGPEAIAENIANLVHNFTNVIDLEGTVIRRCLNAVTKNDPDAKNAVLQVLRSNFDLDVDGAIDADDEFDQENVPGGKNGSPALAQ